MNFDLDTLRENRAALRAAWLDRRVDGETAVGPIFGRNDELSMYVRDANGVRTRDIVILPDGEIFERR